MQIVRFAALSAIFAAALPAADPRLLNLVMPQARILAGINTDQAKSTPFGQAVLDRMAANEESMYELSEVTGFDPRRDVREVLYASAGERDGNGRLLGILLVRGAFDVARIAQAAKEKGGSVENHAGATVITRPGKNSALGFADPTVAVAGATAEVLAALDRRSAPAPIDPALMAQITRLSAQHAWGVTDAVQQFLPSGLPGLLQAGVLNSIELASGGLTFGSNVVFTGQLLANTEQDAAALALIARLLAQLAQTSGQPAPGTDLLKNLQVSTSGRSVNLGLTVPEDRFEQLVFERR